MVIMDTMSENVRQIARRLSRTRRFSIDGTFRTRSSSAGKKPSPPANNNTIMRNYSEAGSLQSEGFSSFGHRSLQMFPDKIKTWMSRSLEILDIVDDVDEDYHDNVFGMNRQSGSDNSSNVSDKSDKYLPKKLKRELSRTNSVLYEVPWDVKKCDLFIQVENFLFPVEKNFIVYVSEKFQQEVDNSLELRETDAAILKLNGYTLNEVKTILTFAYSVDGVQITDQNVASLFQLGDEFKVSRLTYQCEKHIRNSKTFNPLIAVHLAKQYGLQNLLEYAYCEISKIENVEETQEFQLLDVTAQNQILKFLLMRYKKASKTLSQFDVHLCNHHGNDPKNNNCCFRAATYSTENDRTFLVKMENPEKKLMEKFNVALRCDSSLLATPGEQKQFVSPRKSSSS